MSIVDDPVQRLLKAGVRSYRLFLLQAALTVIAVLGCLALTHTIKNAYTSSLSESEKWTRLSSRFFALGRMVDEVNVAGNQIRKTNDAANVTNRVEQRVLLRFEFSDTGIGIPEAALPRLFQPFTRADSSVTRHYGGTGLGLAICKQLVEIMGGQIGVESEQDQGSTFWFTAEFETQASAGRANPSRRATNVLSENDEPGAAGTLRPDSTLNPTDAQALAGLRVLIVEDNAAHCRILEQRLSNWNMHPVTAFSGPEALARLRQAVSDGDSCSLAILDSNMPGMDGFQVAERIHDDPVISSTRLILMTPVAALIEENVLLARGIRARLPKPINQSNLLRCLRIAVGNPPPAPEIVSEDQPLRIKPIGGDWPHPPRILLVEDNPVSQQVALGILKRLGLSADISANRRDALDALTRGFYEIVLMDCQMPVLNGYDTTREIRRREREVEAGMNRQRPVHIIAMTANALNGDRDKCHAAGMDDYLSKPLRIEEFEAAIASGLEQRNEPVHPEACWAHSGSAATCEHKKESGQK